MISGVDVIPGDVVSMALLTSGISNMADIDDVDDDLDNEIYTIPVQYGKPATSYINEWIVFGCGVNYDKDTLVTRTTTFQTTAHHEN